MSLSKTFIRTFLSRDVLILSNALAQDAQVEQGRNLTEGISNCTDCHTPSGEAGEPVRTEWPTGVRPERAHFDQSQWLIEFSGKNAAAAVAFLKTRI